MIIVVAPHPSTENQKDGMIQRIAHIDSLMTSSPRTYLDISVRRFIRKQVLVEDLVTIQRLNLLVHFFQIARLIRKANLIYIHSAYNALKACLFPTKAHIVFDAHGIVPEELAQEGHTHISRVFAVAERHALKRCNTLVCVTRSMLNHFNAKYGYRTERQEIVLPILPRLADEAKVKQAHHARRTDNSVIYAGGMQVWQNIDKMIAAASKRPDCTYTFLSGDADQLRDRLEYAGITQFYCESVLPQHVKDYYLKNHFGFILREQNLVNAVACPTKLVEYLYWGVIPIFITPRIGDFDEKNLCGVTLDVFETGILPDNVAIDQMRHKNQVFIMDLITSAQCNEDELRDILRSFEL